jgi:hypothetical protein
MWRWRKLIPLAYVKHVKEKDRHRGKNKGLGSKHGVRNREDGGKLKEMQLV